MTAKGEWFGTVTGDVAFDPKVTGSMARVYLVLVMYRNNEDNTCFPSNETIAENSGMSLRTVTRALSDLVELGVIRRQPQYRDGRQVNSLTILTDAMRPRRKGTT